MRRPMDRARRRMLPTVVVTLLVGAMVLATLGLGTGGRPAAASLAGGGSLLSSAASSSAYDWPEFHSSPSLDGYTANTTLTASNAGSLGVAWATNLYSAALDSPVVAYDPLLHETLAYIGTEAGNVLAVNVANGKIVWGHWFGAPIRTTPVVENGSVYLGTDTTPTLYRLNASDGSVDCRLVAPMPIEGTPVVVTPPGGERTLYVGTNDNAYGNGPLVAMNADTCAPEWQFNGYNQTSGSWDPVAYATDQVGEPLVVFGSADPDSSVYALDAVTGAEVWRYQTYNPGAYDVGAGVTVSAPGVNGFSGGVAYVPNKLGIMYALGLTSGALIWQTNFNAIAHATEGGRSTAALDGTDLVFGYNGGMFDLNADTGAVNWQFPDLTKTEVLSSPAIVGPTGEQVVVAGDIGGSLDVVGLAHGNLLYHYKTGGYIVASPAVSDGTILIASSDGFLYAFRTGGGNDAGLPTTAMTSPGPYSVVTNPNGNLTLRGTANDSVGVASVEVAVETDGPSGAWWDAASHTWESGPLAYAAKLASPGATSTTWTIPIAIPKGGGTYQVTADAVSISGQADIHGPTVDFTVLASTKGAHIKVSPSDIAPGATVTVTGGGFGKSETVSISFEGTVLATTTTSASGSVLSTKVKIPTHTSFGLGALVAVGGTTNLSASAAVTVTNSWEQLGYNAGHTNYAPNDPTLFNHVNVGNETWLDVAWHFEAGTAVDSSPVVVNEVAYVADTGGQLFALAARNGGLLWTWTLPSHAAIYASPAVDPVRGLAFVASSDGTLTAVSLSSGTTVWSTAVGGNLSAPVYGNGQLYVTSSSGTVAQYVETTGALVWSASLASPSAAPPALDTSKGLLVLGESYGDVVALANATGAQKWTFTAGGSVVGPAMISQGAVYVGATNGVVYSLSESTGSVLWSYTTGGAITAGSALLTQGGKSGLELAVGAGNGEMYALQALTGALEFEVNWKSPVVGLGAIDGIIVGETLKGTVDAVRGYTNLDVWAFATGAPLASSPVIVDGTVFVGAENGYLYAFTSFGQSPV